MSDDQFGAEQLDEDVTADDEPVLSDEVGHWRPTVPVGVPFADSDVTDESLADRVDRLPEILADRIHAPGPGRMPSMMEPGELHGRLVSELDAITEAAALDNPDQVTDGDLARAAEQLAALELEVSTLRRALFDRIDALQAELTRRYRDGETTVDDLLAGTD